MSSYCEERQSTRHRSRNATNESEPPETRLSVADKSSSAICEKTLHCFSSVGKSGRQKGDKDKQRIDLVPNRVLTRMHRHPLECREPDQHATQHKFTRSVDVVVELWSLYEDPERLPCSCLPTRAPRQLQLRGVRHNANQFASPTTLCQGYSSRIVGDWEVSNEPDHHDPASGPNFPIGGDPGTTVHSP